MQDFLLIGLIIAAIVLVNLVSRNASHKRKVFKNNSYRYTAKRSLMSNTESDFFVKLQRTVAERYYVFPQVHLSAILDHRVKGQEWQYAFRHINGKSVDYVLCDKATLMPAYAIELDDYTHDRPERKKRDEEVERIFAGANLPLVRFRNKDVSEGDIIHALTQANETAAS